MPDRELKKGYGTALYWEPVQNHIRIQALNAYQALNNVFVK